MKDQERVSKIVDALAPELKTLALNIHDNPELGLQEFKACAWQKELLAKYGFQIEDDFCNLETAYKAVYKGKKQGPKIAFLAEYDALPGLGHGCGHNLIAMVAVGCGIACREFADEYGAEIDVIGTPAEETAGTKVPMSAMGVFKDYDAVMMAHPMFSNTDCFNSIAMDAYQIEFFGKPAHAANTPYEGINALDAMINFFNLINAMRQETKPDARIHGIITDGADKLDRRTGFLCFEPCVDVDADVGFGEVLAVQTAAGHGVAQVRAELPVGSTRVNIRAAGPITERIDLGIWEDLTQMAGLGVALAEDQAVAVQNVFSVAAVGFIELLGDGGELLLLIGHRNAFEDAIIAAVNAADLVVSQMFILRNLTVVHQQVPSDTGNRRRHLIRREGHRGFGDNMADAVADQDLDSDLRVIFFLIRKVDKSTGDAVGYLIGMRRVYFFKHISFLSER